MEQRKTPGKKRSFRDYLKIFFCGAIMGSADVVPGVSGGTMAFILGIYNELLDSIKQILSPSTVEKACKFRVKELYKTLPWPFLLSLGTGILFAIGLFSSPISWMLNNRLALILAFFFGLVLGSVATVWHKVKNWSIDRYIALILGAVGGFVLVGLPVLATPPEGKWYIVICGAIAISAMILPGISGSFILLLMGKYQYVLDAVNQLKSRVNIAENLLTLLLFGAGIIIGLAAFVRFLSWLLKKYHDVTVALLIGFMLGSLRKVWPWKVADNIANANVMPEINTAFFLALLLAAAGLVLVVAVEYVARKMENNNNGEM